jgi:hypothetical protein
VEGGEVLPDHRGSPHSSPVTIDESLGRQQIRRRDRRYPRILTEVLSVEREEVSQPMNRHRDNESSIVAVLADHRRSCDELLPDAVNRRRVIKGLERV